MELVRLLRGAALTSCAALCAVFYNISMAIAYFITFSTYGTWLHGTDKQERSVNRNHNIYGSPKVPVNENLQAHEKKVMKQEPFVLDKQQRDVVLTAIIEISNKKSWKLWAAHVRTNHVHIIVSSQKQPQRIMSEIKAKASHKLNKLGFDDNKTKRWTRRGSIRHLFTNDDIAEKMHYVINEQGKPMALYDSRKFKEPRT